MLHFTLAIWQSFFDISCDVYTNDKCRQNNKRVYLENFGKQSKRLIHLWLIITITPGHKRENTASMPTKKDVKYGVSNNSELISLLITYYLTKKQLDVLILCHTSGVCISQLYMHTACTALQQKKQLTGGDTWILLSFSNVVRTTQYRHILMCSSLHSCRCILLLVMHAANSYSTRVLLVTHSEWSKPYSYFIKKLWTMLALSLALQTDIKKFSDLRT